MKSLKEELIETFEFIGSESISGNKAAKLIAETIDEYEKQLKILNMSVVSNNEVAVCDHPPSELKLDSGGFKFCKNCGTYPQTDC